MWKTAFKKFEFCPFLNILSHVVLARESHDSINIFQTQLRDKSHIDFRMQCVIMMLAIGERGTLLMTFLNSEKLSNLKVHAL